MRAVFSLLGLVLALLVVGLLAKKQLTSVTRPVAPVAASNTMTPAASAPVLNPSGVYTQAQGEQLQQQVKQAVEAAMQQPRPMPDDVK